MKNVFIMLLAGIIFLSFVTVFCPFETCDAAGNTLYVGGGGPGNYTKIQDAVNAANGGDIIYVDSGTYYENIAISKNITLTGEDRDNTVIDGSNNDHVINVNGERFSEIELYISGFTIRNAGGTGNDCIALSFVNAGEIDDNQISNSVLSDGIQMDHCSGVTVSNNLINNNAAAGISLTLSENNIIHDNMIQNNYEGIYIYYSSNNNQIYSNTITGNDYGIHIAQEIQSSGNYFYLNDLKNNIKNAEDPHTNYWSYSSQGNYWDDYNNYDSNNDGIGDTPYDIPGGGENQDLYPLGYFKSESPSENQAPTADAGGSYSGYKDQLIQFDASGSDDLDGTIIGYQWDWTNDGSWDTSWSTSSYATHGYISEGIYTVKLQVKDNDGATDTDITTVTITNVSTTLHFTYSPSNPHAGEIISFDASTIDDVIQYDWKWSDEENWEIDLGASPSHVYSTPGDYAVTLRVYDNEYETDIYAETVTVKEYSPSENQAPTADAGGPYSGNVNVSLSFNGSNSYDPDEDNIVSYEWDFGDGTNSTGTNPTHIYSAVGNYTVTLTVTDDHASKNTDSTYVNIVQPNNQNNNGTSKTPGFEIVFVIISVALILLWKRHKLKTN
jgi:parallel beta-helix repeat protein